MVMDSVDDDNFMPCFKYYKQKLNPPSFDDVMDFSVDDCQLNGCTFTYIAPPADSERSGLDVSSKWKLFEIDAVPGLFFLPNPFTDEGQLLWSRRCLEEYAKPPNKTNLDINKKLDIASLWSDTCQDVKMRLEDNGMSDEKDKLGVFKSSPIWGLRWATLGYHHNWDTKVYSESEKSVFPAELNQLSRIFSTVIGCPDYNAQAAIINFYHAGSTLSAHTDSSEHDLTFPLISVSFGLSAVFLIGGETKKKEPKAIFIRSGDVLFMTKQSRMSYHAVARVLSYSEDTQMKKLSIPNENPVKMYLESSRINMNVRQLRS